MATLLIMAAGIGSRFGGVKQIEPIGAGGELIIDYSIYDAMLAGFDRVVFVIRRDIERDFCERIFGRIAERLKAEYVFQDTPEWRAKPFGTVHAVLAARDVIHEPFCAINADDFYGRAAFDGMKKFFDALPADSENYYSMIGYKLCNTLSEKGAVTRGVCSIDKHNILTRIDERQKVQTKGDKFGYLDGEAFTELSPNSDVSMNFWGFTPDVMGKLQTQFDKFLRDNPNDPKAELPIPVALDGLIADGTIKVEMIPCESRWFGFTYPEDKVTVKNAVAEMTEQGIYPSPLWEDK